MNNNGCQTTRTSPFVLSSDSDSDPTYFQANFPHYLSPSEKHLTGQNPFLEPGPATKPSLVDMKGKQHTPWLQMQQNLT